MPGFTEEILQRLRDAGVAPIAEVNDGFMDDLWAAAYSIAMADGDEFITVTVPEDEVWDLVNAAIVVTSVGTSTHYFYVIPKTRRSNLLATSSLAAGTATAQTSEFLAKQGGTAVASGTASNWEPSRRVVLGPGDAIKLRATAAAGDTLQARLLMRSRKLRT